jgi:hypothetical protein
MKFGGFLGGLMNRAAGDAAKDGLTSTVAAKGSRLSRVNDQTGQIIDLSEEKVYDLDIRKKEYRVTTFDELRRRFQKAQADAAKQTQAMKPEERDVQPASGKEMEFEVEVKETGQHRTIAGYETREVTMTTSGHEKGRKIDDSGGFVLTTDLWLGPKIDALKEISDFDTKYAMAIYGSAVTGVDMNQMATMLAMYPAFSQMAERTSKESGKLEGTPLVTTTTLETIKSAEAMKAGADQAQSGGGGGLGGMLARRVVQRGPAQQRSMAFTVGTELLSVEASASADDVALPAGFKEKK